MTPILPRFYRHQEAAADHEKITRNLLKSGHMAADLPGPILSRLGDERQLRGVPVLAKGVGSHIHGTSPLAALMAKQPHK